jgi:3-polyprenyl-4-hydroxybenzoate decarboxylase
MRTFVRLRRILATHKQLAERLAALEKRCDQNFKEVFDVLQQLIEAPPEPPEPPKRPIGFIAEKN